MTEQEEGEGFTFASVRTKRQLTTPMHWNEAFRVLMFVELRAHPEKSSQMIQYMININTAFKTYTFETVYMYDKDFRLSLAVGQMSSWASSNDALRAKMIVRPKLQFADFKPDPKPFQKYTNNEKKTETTRPTKTIQPSYNAGRADKDFIKCCRSFNKGACTYGDNCDFPHMCFHCYGKHRVSDCPEKKKSHGRGSTPTR